MATQAKLFPFVALLLFLCISQRSDAGLTSQAAREVAEQVMRKFGRTVGSETVETLTRKTMQLSTKYGDEAAVAVQKVGPRVFRLADEAGEHGGEVVRLLSKYGDDAVLICGKPQSLRLVSQFGDDAAEALIRHGDNAGILVAQNGKSAAGALAKIDKQSGRRLVQMNEGGELAKIGGADKVFDVVGKYGQKGMDFIWNNKGALAVGTVALAFYKDPEPFINGAMQLPGTILEIPPLKTANWTLIILAIVAAVATYFMVPHFWKMKRNLQQKKDGEIPLSNVESR